MSTPPDAQAAFAIGRVGFDGDTALQRQYLSPSAADHRGRIELPAFAVLVDSIGGTPFWRSYGQPVATVQARLSMQAAGSATPSDELAASARLVHRDDVYGSTTIELATATGIPVCSALARNMRVDRGMTTTEVPSAFVAPAPDTGISVQSSLPTPIDPALDGKRIVAAIAEGRLDPGPINALLGVHVEPADDGIQLRVSTEAWMANWLGTMHGGVIAAVLGQACSLAAQVHTGPGQDYFVADFTVNFFRSPPVAGDLLVTTQPEKIGRRVGSVSAAMTGADGTPFARAIADVHYR